MVTATVQTSAINKLSFGLCSGNRVVAQKFVNNGRKVVTIKQCLRCPGELVIGFIQIFVKKF